MLINCRFSGMAMQTPSMAMQPTQIIICHHIIGCPVVRYNAGTAEINAPVESEPAALAQVVIVQSSRMLKGRRRQAGMTTSSVLKTAKAMMQEVIVTPNPQPIFNPT